MAEKATKKNRLKRFRKWDPTHKADTLDAIGVDFKDFRNYGDARKRAVLNRALDTVKKNRAEADDPTVLTQPLTPERLNREMESAVRLKYGDEERQVNQQLTGTSQWYDQYRAALAKARTDTAALYQGANLGVANPQVTDPNDPGQMAAANRASVQNAFSGLMQQQGANMTDDYDLMTANTRLSQAGWEKDFRDQLVALAKEKGDFRTVYRADARDKERSYSLENRALFGEEQSDAANRRQQNRLDSDSFKAEHGVDRKTWRKMSPEDRLKWKKRWDESPQTPSDRLNNAKLKFFEKHGYFPGTGKPNGEDGGTNRTNSNYWSAGRNFLQTNKDILKGKHALQAVQDEANVPYDIAQILVQRMRKGYITPAQARKLDKLGVKYSRKIVRGGKSYEDRVDDNEVAGPPAPGR